MKFFYSHGVRLAYRVDGQEQAFPLVMLHALGMDLRMWDPQVAALSETWRLVRYDCRGHGASDVPAGEYTLEQLGNDLIALLDTLQIEQAHLCGLSLGGIVALWCAVMYPQRVERVVLANTAARIGTRESWQARIEAVRAGGIASIRDVLLSRFLSEAFRQQHPATVQQIGNIVGATNPLGYIGACAALCEADLRALARTIRQPTLILAGALDESTPPSQAQELHTALAGSQLLVFDETAHLSNVERSQEFNESVHNFLERA